MINWSRSLDKMSLLEAISTYMNIHDTHIPYNAYIYHALINAYIYYQQISKAYDIVLKINEKQLELTSELIYTINRTKKLYAMTNDEQKNILQQSMKTQYLIRNIKNERVQLEQKIQVNTEANICHILFFLLCCCVFIVVA